MRNANAQLCRQAVFAALACALLAWALHGGSATAQRQLSTDISSDRPILTTTVALEPARPGPEPERALPPTAHAPARALAAVARSPARQRVAALQPAIRPRSATHGDPMLIKAALTPALEAQDVGARFFRIIFSGRNCRSERFAIASWG